VREQRNERKIEHRRELRYTKQVESEIIPDSFSKMRPYQSVLCMHNDSVAVERDLP
jgi:hypothetical protein